MRTDCVICLLCLLTAVVCWILCSSGKIQQDGKKREERGKNWSVFRNSTSLSSCFVCLPSTTQCAPTECGAIATMNKCSVIFTLNCCVECIHWNYCFSKCVILTVVIERLDSPTFSHRHRKLSLVQYVHTVIELIKIDSIKFISKMVLSVFLFFCILWSTTNIWLI